MTPEERKQRLINEVEISRVLDLKTDKYNTCPCCGASAKFSVVNKLAKCQASSCEFNTAKNVIDCYSWKYKVNFWEAVKRLETEFNLANNKSTSERSSLLESCLKVYQYYLWSPQGKEALAYLSSRGFSKDAIREYGLGYSPHGKCLREFDIAPSQLTKHSLLERDLEYYSGRRIILPIRDTLGNLVHLNGRYLGEIPKDEKGKETLIRYKETKTVDGVLGAKTYLGFEERLIKYDSEQVIITEGYLDGLSLAQFGIPVLSSFGLEKISSQASKLKKFKNIVFIFDNDRFADDHIKYPGEYKSWVRVIPQIIELQLSLPESYFYICLVFSQTKGKRTKDVNDWIINVDLSKDEIVQYIREKKRELITYLISKNGVDISNHLDIIKLIKKTGRREHIKELESYIHPKLSILDYVLELDI